MKRQADKGRSERSFAKGDMVFLKLQTYVQTSLARMANNKLSFKFFGPFKILQKIGQVAYKLDLPPQAAIHPVFHVSQLKSSAGPQQVSPLVLSDLQAYQVPLKVLQHRWTDGLHPTEQGLVQWSHMPPELATWEPLVALRQQFPRAPARGHAGSEGEGNVSNQLTSDDLEEAEAGGASSPAKSSAPKSKRTRRSSTHTTGPEWLA
jgi:hypothetical protein